MTRVLDEVDHDPQIFDISTLQLPRYILCDDSRKAKFVAKVKIYQEMQCQAQRMLPAQAGQMLPVPPPPSTPPLIVQCDRNIMWQASCALENSHGALMSPGTQPVFRNDVRLQSSNIMRQPQRTRLYNHATHFPVDAGFYPVL
jgi:hypothetical protein